MSAPGDADVGARDLDAGHHLGLLARLLERLDRGLDVDDVAACACRGWARGPCRPLRCRLVAALADEHRHLGGPDVDADDVLVCLGHASVSFGCDQTDDLADCRRPASGRRARDPRCAIRLSALRLRHDSAIAGRTITRSNAGRPRRGAARSRIAGEALEQVDAAAPRPARGPGAGTAARRGRARKSSSPSTSTSQQRQPPHSGRDPPRAPPRRATHARRLAGGERAARSPIAVAPAATRTSDRGRVAGSSRRDRLAVAVDVEEAALGLAAAPPAARSSTVDPQHVGAAPSRLDAADPRVRLRAAPRRGRAASASRFVAEHAARARARSSRGGDARRCPRVSTAEAKRDEVMRQSPAPARRPPPSSTSSGQEQRQRPRLAPRAAGASTRRAPAARGCDPARMERAGGASCRSSSAPSARASR